MTIDNKDCRFEPHIALMHTSQTLVAANGDLFGHNIKGDLFYNPSFNELIPTGEKVSFNFKKTEKRPMPVACTIHSWMNGWVLIQNHPYFGISNSKGTLTIPHIPDGIYTFVMWHEKGGFIKQGRQNKKVTEWKSGRIDVTIAGDTNLGEFLVKP